MGIPKFFRYISERYPLTSQLIQENKIPEFDNLYLDFNAIIHNCSHPNDDDAHFRLSEEHIFTSIFTYVEHLFAKIRPKKLFFMAVDGVAPRAKMNQQRSRRFRTSKEASEVRAKALAKGEKLPDEKAFDSNCITPGTPFMTRLSEQLRYFVNKKITEDSNWRDIQVVLSGHEVPGEGEHKIMEYIRLSRAQPDYNPNIRHCLYGLDADLIMLGLLSHDPHFCLLREEVKFGPSRRKNNNHSPEAINFYLLHLSLMREYLDLEFHDIESNLRFNYNLERVIDDFILLAVFVGNDFLPNLPDLHIHENGLERLFDTYKRVLPNLDGYINENGVINTRRLQVVLDEMVSWEQEIFEREYSDINWFKGKQSKYLNESRNTKKHENFSLSPSEHEIFEQLKSFILESRNSPSSSKTAKFSLLNEFPAKDRAFITNISEDLHLNVTWDEYDDEDRNVVTWRVPGTHDDDEELDQDVQEGDDEDSAWNDEDDEEANAAVDRILNKYEKATVVDLETNGSFDERHERMVKEKMDDWKREYYREKLELSYDDPKAMGDLTFRYVEGLQWVMHYYYSGVASWGWFYNYHYAPRISDLQGLTNYSFEFALGRPFKPFEQLMGVLPVASKDNIPSAYQDLMDGVNSPILDFYPLEFEQDLNGKKQDWEAIVKIPFIDEKRLLEAMAGREHRLTKEERSRNSLGTSLKFQYNPNETKYYPSSLPGFFPPLPRCACIMEPFDLPTLDGLHLIPGLCDGVALGKEALAGFPSLNTLPHTASVGYHGVTIHGTASRNQSMIIHIENPYEGQRMEELAETMIGERTFMGWPFLQEGQVVGISDALFRYEKLVVTPSSQPKVIPTQHSIQGLSHWKAKAERIENHYSKKCGVLTGTVDVLLHIRPLKGLKRLETGAFVKDYEGPDKEVEQVLQMCLPEVVSEDPRFMERDAPPLADEFPEGTKVFFLGEHAYGGAAQVSSTTETTLSVILLFDPSEKEEIEKFKSIVGHRHSMPYFPSYRAAEMVNVSGRALGKITSSFMVVTSDNQKINLGLSIKFEAKSMKVLDYSRKDGRSWEYSQKAVDLIMDYKKAFPEVFRAVERSGDAMITASEVFPGNHPDGRVLDVRHWLKAKGVRDFESVSLYCDQLTKETVQEIEALADEITQHKPPNQFKRVIVKGIPRQAILKPAHALYRLQNQHFAIGDRIVMIQDSGSVPLSVKGVVIGLNAKTMDVVWDVPFMSGGTQGGRCSQYRGSTVEFDICLNLTNPQFVTPTNPKAPLPVRNSQPFKPRFGQYPAIRPLPGREGASGFRPAPKSSQQVHIMSNPNRGRGGYTNGRPYSQVNNDRPPRQNTQGEQSSSDNTAGTSSTAVQGDNNAQNERTTFQGPSSGGNNNHRGGFREGSGRGYRGRGRGSPRGFRGRGRGSFAAPVTS